MNTLAIIPARYGSTRFPGKPLSNIAGKKMIQRVYEQTNKAIKNIVVATDDNRIFDEVKKFGGNAVITSKKHKTGTDRCVEALNLFSEQQKTKYNTIVNIQGDEPLINPEAIKTLVNLFKQPQIQIGTLVNKHKFTKELLNTNRVKVIIDKNKKAIYFSRTLIPFIRDDNTNKQINFYTHIGIYAFKANIIKSVSKLNRSMLEISENLEQNRWIENGYTIHTQQTDYQSIPVDTPEDIKIIEKILDKIQHK